MIRHIRLAFLFALLWSGATLYPTDVSAQGGLSCGQAVPIICGSTVTGSTAGTPPDGVTTGNFEGTGGQHWYRYTAPANGAVTLSLCSPSTSYDSRLHVYSGACGPYTFIAQDDDACITPGLASELTWAVTTGTTYLIRVGGYFGGSGQYQGVFTCNLSILGCMNVFACNYDSNATQDSGACDLISCYGCTYPQATNFNPAATYDSGTCQFNVVANGCIDPDACNYCNLCQTDNGSCDYSCLGCTYPDAANYDPLATADDGSCLFPGCTDPNAYNFNPIAGIDDGTCDLAGNCLGDFNQDSTVGVADVLMFIAAFGGVCN